MNLKEATAIAGSLSNPSKMPGYGYGLPAKECKTGGRLVNIANSVCSICYARKGQYVFPNVQNAQYKRLASLRHPLWVDAMVMLIGKKKSKSRYFRWHDSGDIQDEHHLNNICEVARRLSDMVFYLPTKEYGVIRKFKGEVPPNLIIRTSAPMIDGKVASEFPLNAVTTKDKSVGFACPAPTQGNKCVDCRACWDPTVKLISYRSH